MRYICLLTTAVLLALPSAVSAQAPGDPVAAVDSWYRTYLGRTALNDPSSMGWVNQVRQGYPPMAVIAGILGSDEYFRRVGGTMPAFIQAVYREAVGRPVSPSEYNFWMQRAYTQSRRDLAYEMLTQSPAGGSLPPPPPAVPDWQRHDYRRPYYPYRW